MFIATSPIGIRLVSPSAETISQKHVTRVTNCLKWGLKLTEAQDCRHELVIASYITDLCTIDPFTRAVI